MIPMYQGRPLGWDGGSCWLSDYLLNKEDGKERRVWSTLAMEEGIFWNMGEE